MKDLFPGFFYDASKIYAEVWEDGIVVPDANVLLNMYRYSDDTRKEFLTVLMALSERLWIPNQVALEFLRNRLTVIGDQAETYNKSLQDISSVLANFKKSTHHPVVSTEALTNLKTSCDVIKTELEENRDICLSLINDDPIKLEIGKLFLSKVGDAYDDNRLKDLVGEGAVRYERRTPPGYMDASKKPDASDYLGLAPYGDLIIWKQLLEHAKRIGRDVIFITGDSKDDWWLRVKGKIITPRPELIEEFQDVVGKNIILYSPERFLEYYNEQSTSEKVSQSAYAEVVEMSSVDRETSSNFGVDNAFAYNIKSGSAIYHRYFDIKSRQDELKAQLAQHNSIADALRLRTQVFTERYAGAHGNLPAEHVEKLESDLASFNKRLMENMNIINRIESELMALEVDAVHALQEIDRFHTKP